MRLYYTRSFLWLSVLKKKKIKKKKKKNGSSLNPKSAYVKQVKYRPSLANQLVMRSLFSDATIFNH